MSARLETIGAAYRRMMGQASGVSDRRLGLIIASSLAATATIIAGGYATGGDNALAGELAQMLADRAPAIQASTSAGSSGPLGPSAPIKPVAGATAPPPASPASSPTQPTASPAPQTTTAPHQPSNGPSGPTGPTGTTGPTGPTSPVKHVFVIALTSPGYEASFGDSSQMPYLAGTLRSKGELLSSYSLLDSGGLDNYIAMTSGQEPNELTSANCPKYKEFSPKAVPNSQTGLVPGDGCVYSPYALTLADQLQAAGQTWRAYLEGMSTADGSANCVHADSGATDTTRQDSQSGEYASWHNPFVYYHSLLDLGSCSSNDVPLSSHGAGLANDLKKASTTPAYSFVVPDLCHSGGEATCADGSPGGPAAADAFLRAWVPKIMASAAYKQDGLIVVTFGDSADPAAKRNRAIQAGTVLLSKFVPANSTLGGPFTPYSLLRSVEDIFGLTNLAKANSSSVASFAATLAGGGD